MWPSSCYRTVSTGASVDRDACAFLGYAKECHVPIPSGALGVGLDQTPHALEVLVGKPLAVCGCSVRVQSCEQGRLGERPHKLSIRGGESASVPSLLVLGPQLVRKLRPDTLLQDQVLRESPKTQWLGELLHGAVVGWHVHSAVLLGADGAGVDHR